MDGWVRVDLHAIEYELTWVRLDQTPIISDRSCAILYFICIYHSGIQICWSECRKTGLSTKTALSLIFGHQISCMSDLLLWSFDNFHFVDLAWKMSIFPSGVFEFWLLTWKNINETPKWLSHLRTIAVLMMYYIPVSMVLQPESLKVLLRLLLVTSLLILDYDATAWYNNIDKTFLIEWLMISRLIKASINQD